MCVFQAFYTLMTEEYGIPEWGCYVIFAVLTIIVGLLLGLVSTLLKLYSVNPFPNKPWFLRVCSTSLLKTQWEKEKLLATSNFSFSRSVF